MFARAHRYLGLLVISVTVFFAHPAAAITIVPPSLEFTAQKGETVRTEIKLYNESNEAITLFPSTANFTSKDQNGTPDFDPAGKQVDLAGWIKVTQGSYHLEPNEKIVVPITISVPTEADAGGHYAAVFFGNAPGASGGSGVAIQSKIGTLVIMRVEGQINESASVTSWNVQGGKHSLTRPPVAFEAVIANGGNVHLRPEGTVTIRNMFGGQTAALVFNGSRGAILPSSSRRFDVTWKKGSADDQHGSFFHEVGAEWHNFSLGTYTASLAVSYGSNQQALAGDIRFTIFPWQLLLVMVILLVVVSMLLTFGIRWYNAAIIRRAQGRLPPTGGRQ